MRVLDEVAEAIQRARGRLPRPVLSTFGLEEQFGHPITAREWGAIQKYLACPLPPVEFVQGHWFLPDGFATIWDLVDHAADAHPDWEPPGDHTEDAWRNAQVFAGVRAAVADACGVSPGEVTREARFVDLFGD